MPNPQPSEPPGPPEPSKPTRPAAVKGMDIPIVKLTPLHKRTVTKKAYERLLANLKAVGLIEPLCVCQENGQFYLLDGYVRYTALVECGVETVPCLVLDSRDLYTLNRQVNQLSPKEQTKMLRKALENLTEQDIADAFGLQAVNTKLNTALYRDLHPELVEELKNGKLLQVVAQELAFVVRSRQHEILLLMRESGDWSLAFVKAQVLTTPALLRSKKRRQRGTPWEQSQRKKRDLVKKLAEVEKHFDFYSGLYRQYVGDLLKLAIYVRQIVTRPELREYLAAHHPKALMFFDSVLAESESKAAG